MKFVNPYPFFDPMMSTVPKRKRRASWRPAMLTAALVAATALSQAGSLPANPAAVVITRNLNSKKHKVKLFAAANSKTLLFSVDGVNGKRYTIFVFDLDGKLVSQAVIGNHETGILPEVRPGGYLYEVLTEDEEVESGQLTIR